MEMRSDAVLCKHSPYTIGQQGTQFPLPQPIAIRTEQLILSRLKPLPPVRTPIASQMDEAPLLAGEPIGRDYQSASEDFSATLRDFVEIDPALVERANRSHAKLQNLLARHLETKGLVPRSYGEREPNFDIAWIQDGAIYIAEVKGLTKKNEETQLRLGLSQVLMYRHRFARSHAGTRVHAVLLIEWRPTFDRCETLGEELGVLLVWKDNLNERL
jgi:hypothetical protein